LRNPLVGPALGVLAGAWLGFQCAWDAREVTLGALSFAALYLWARRRAPRFSAPILFLLFALLSAGNAWWRRPVPPSRALLVTGQRVDLQGCVVGEFLPNGEGGSFVVEIAPGARVRVSATAALGVSSLAAGTFVTFPATINHPRAFLNPGSFDYPAWLAARDIYWLAHIPTRGVVHRLPGRCGSFWSVALERCRMAALRRIDSLYPNSTYHRSMFKGLLLGDATEIRRVWIDDYRRTGTYHALVISGSHIALVAGLLLFWLRFARYGERTVLVSACALAWLYALLAGAEAPVLRAAAGFSVAVSSRLLYRRPGLLNVLAFVLLAFLLCAPWQINEASFQLSFLAVAAIAALVEPLLDATSRPLSPAFFSLAGKSMRPLADPRAAALRVELSLLAETLSLTVGWTARGWRAVLARAGRVALVGFGVVLLSCAVQFALLLPMLVYFHRVSLTGLSANLIATPLVLLAVPVGLGAVVTGWGWVARAAALLLDVAGAVVEWHATWEPKWRVPDPPTWLTVAIAALVVAACILLRSRRGWSLLCSCGAACGLGLAIWHPFATDLQPGVLELTAIDVGQGDSLLLGLPSGVAMLVDTGGIPVRGQDRNRKLDTGEDVVSPYLWSRGIRRLSAVAITHLHEDHVGGLAAILENFRPGQIWTGALPHGPATDALRRLAARWHIPVHTLIHGDKLALEGATFTVLAPYSAQSSRRVPANHDSLVLLVRYGRHCFLLTGDTDALMEARVVEDGPLPSIQVLKVPHHGSRTGFFAPLLEATHPSVALISTGENNPYGLPNPTLLNELARRHMLIFRTDRDGLVQIRSDGRTFSFLTERSSLVPAARMDPF
jgi:competence protein ComEC